MPEIKVAPSILSADILHLEDEIKAIEKAGADLIHIDIMDGHFVPNLTYGPGIVKALKKTTDLPLDVHLMIDNPQVYIKHFAKAGADNITVHAEAGAPIPRLHEIVKSFGIEFGVSIKPDSSLDLITDCLDLIDMLLIMTVYPGFGGQKFIEATIPTIKKAARLKAENGYKYQIEVDGGLNGETVKAAASAGASVIVAGSYIFGAKDYNKAIASLRLSEPMKIVDEELKKAAFYWTKYVRTKRDLMKEGYSRSFKQLEAEFAEWLIAHVMNGKLATSRSQAGFDVITNDNKKIQVKSIAKAPTNKNGYIIKPKDRNNETSTHYAFVCFNNLIPEAIYVVPTDYVKYFEKSQIKRSYLEKTEYRLDIDLSVFRF